MAENVPQTMERKVRLVGFRCVECPDPKPEFPSEREAWRHIVNRHQEFVFQEYMEWLPVDIR
jgi:hypothetical protein